MRRAKGIRNDNNIKGANCITCIANGNQTSKRDYNMCKVYYSNKVSKAWPVSVRSPSPDGPNKNGGVGLAHSKSEARAL